MTVKILIPGMEPEQTPIRGDCPWCGCAFEFMPADAKPIFDHRYGNFYSIPCPYCKRDYTKQVGKRAKK